MRFLQLNEEILMSEQYTHSYITFSILNCCNFLKFYVFLWVLWVYRWFKYRYENWDEKVHKTEHSGANENWRKKFKAIVDRSQYISRSIGRNFKEQEQKGRATADRSRYTSRSIGTISEDRPQHSRSIATTPTKPNLVSADRSRT